MSQISPKPFRERSAGNGVTFLHREGGETCLVLLHGIGSRGSSFVEFAGALPPHAEVIAWDAPGYGSSAPLAQAWPVPRDYAAALASLLDELGGRRAIVVGHSLGALIAASFARIFGAQGLVLLSPALGHGASQGGPMPEAAQARIDAFEHLGAAGFAKSRALKLIHDPSAKPDLLAEVTRTLATMQQPGYGQAVRMLASGRLLDDLAHVEAPCLILCGEADSVTPPAMAMRVESAIRARVVPTEARLVLVPGAGHMIYLEAPEFVARELRDFIARIEAARG
ncbi:MAG: alpha/beta hydrolase [Hyphomicrobiales bacterium]|nr:alpha/beta hydrolase [Hyphomicrobiales bacterium]